MQSKCAIATCRNRGKLNGDRILTYHRFPCDKTLRRRWVHLCRRADSFKPENSCVCSDHFDNNNYMRDLKAELLGLPPKLKLKDDAEPHINLCGTAKGSCDMINGLPEVLKERRRSLFLN